jgi:hypothetical protein
MNRSLLAKIGGPLIGFGMAMFAHSFHNTLAGIPFFGDLTCFIGTFLDWFGVFFMSMIIIWATWMEQRNIINHLREEVQMGIITSAQYRTASSAWMQAFARLAGILSGRFSATSRFYQVCGELAHKKQQLAKVGDEGGNSAIIERYRAELANLAPKAQS